MPFPLWARICDIWEGVCVNMYVHVLYVLCIGLTSVSARLEEFTINENYRVGPNYLQTHTVFIHLYINFR